jgi:hypothetical protein
LSDSVDVQRAKHVPCLPPLQEAEDGERDREQEHRPPPEDQGVADEEEDHSWYPEADDPDVEERDEVVDPRDELREQPSLLRGWMRAEAFEHSACPA